MHFLAALLFIAALTPQPHEPDEPAPDPDAVLIAQTIWGEARGCSEADQEAVCWVILNRVDTNDYGMGHSIEYVITFPQQFAGYSPDNPLDPELYDLALRVITDWQNGSDGIGKQWLWFTGDGSKNTFRDQYKGGNERVF